MSPLTIQQLRNRSARCWLRMLQRSCLRIHRLRWAMASLRLLRLVWKWRKYELLMVFWWGALVDDGHVYSHWFICYYVSRKLIVFFHDLRVSILWHSTIYIISRRLIECLKLTSPFLVCVVSILWHSSTWTLRGCKMLNQLSDNFYFLLIEWWNVFMLSQLLKLLNSNTENPLLIWDNATRAELTEFLTEQQLQIVRTASETS